MTQAPNQAINRLFQQALRLHETGQSSQALAAYRQLLLANPSHIDALHYAGVACLQLGQLIEAKHFIEQSLQLAPEQADALSNLAVVLNALHEYRLAIDACNKSLALAPNDLGTLLNRANGYKALGRFSDAETDLRTALLRAPNDARLIYNLANLQFDQQNYSAAVPLFESALSRLPDNPEILQNLAAAHIKSNENGKALEILDRLIVLQPKNKDAWSSRGVALTALGQLEGALTSHDQALVIDPSDLNIVINRCTTLNRLKRHQEVMDCLNTHITAAPNNPDLFCELGSAYLGLGRFEEATHQFKQCLAITPNHASAWTNLGAIQARLGNNTLALDQHQQSLKLDPLNPIAWNNLGLVLQALGRPEEALGSVSKALAIRPHFTEAYLTRASIFLAQSAVSAALDDLKEALRLNPNLDLAPGLRTHARMMFCDWEGLDDEIREISERISVGQMPSPIFPVLSMSDSAQLQFQIATRVCSEVSPANQTLGAIPQHSAHTKIKVAYISGDFRESPAAFNMSRFFELHDRTHFETIGVSFGPNTGDAMRQRLEHAFDHFLDVRESSDVEIAQQLRTLGVDIAIDIMGPTKNSRTGIFALRAAPIQVNNFGWVSGAPYMDYIIADPICITAKEEAFFNERIVRLPNTFFATDNTRSIAAFPTTRSDAGLPEQGFVFCAFNNSYKITPAVFSVWMRLLLAVPGSVLWLKDKSTRTRDNLRKEASIRGIDPDRLIFAGHVASMEEHLARHRLADLFLDNFPFSAQTTASDALWAGLPIVTRSSEAMMSRVAASLLHAVGLPELVTTSEAEYEALALALATHPEMLGAVRKKLVENIDSTPLFDSEAYTRAMEQAFLQMTQRYRRGESPANITISAPLISSSHVS